MLRINLHSIDKSKARVLLRYISTADDASSTLPNTNGPLPSQAQVVIAGAGIVANSVAYHLVKNGWTDILVLEQNNIGSGSSDFGCGMLGLFKPIAMRNVITYSLKLYKQIQDNGFDVGLKQCGSLNLAQTKDRMIAFKRRLSYNVPTGLQCEMISPRELKKYHPYVRTDDLQGAVWVPEDAVANPKAICLALATLAKQGGVEYREHVLVQQVNTNNGHVHSVTTEKGTVKCEYFVNCAGMWARELGLRCQSQVTIPAYPAQHFYATADVTIEDANTPCLRDYDSHLYCREWQGKLLVGWFEQAAKPAFEDSQVPRNWKEYLKEDFKHFMPLWESAIHRLPILKDVLHPQLTNSPDNFTPDGRWILGESPEVKNYYVACGMNGNSLQGSGGIGRTVAEWIIYGRPTADLLPFNVARFLSLHNNRQYLQQRTKEVVGRHYSILFPHQCEYKFARKLRCSPLYTVLEKRGAVFGIKMAYERALYFDSSYKRGDPLPQMPPGSFFKPKFFDFMKEEYLACRQGVGIIDMSSFSKIEIHSGLEGEDSTSNEVVKYLQKMCSNDVNIPIGGMVHTGMQNEEGGYENDCMLVREGESDYFMVSPSSQQTRVYDWMNRNLPQDHSVVLTDVTSAYTVINVVGPKSHELMNELSTCDVVVSPFTFKRVDVGYVSDVMVMAFTHTGEPGYCLYVPSEYALHVYDRLMTVGRDFGVRDVGTLTQRFMRIERFIPFWAEELTSSVTPYEVGHSYGVKLDKEYFIGKYALQHQKEKGVTKRLVMFHLEDHDSECDIWPWGGEPLYRNDQFVGTVTSAGYGFTVNKLVCLGFIHKPEYMEFQRRKLTSQDESRFIINSDFIMDKNANYYIDIAGTKFKLSPHLHAPLLHDIKFGTKTSYKPTVVVKSSAII